ncbi:unnamed protein product, partial [Adineta steineri]
MNISIWSNRNLLIIWIFSVCCITIYIKLKYNRKQENLFEGHFWVFTDSHVDVRYRDDGDPATRCQNISLKNITKRIRKYGHFDCDTPSELLTSAFSAAKKIDSNIDFIIWLG